MLERALPASAPKVYYHGSSKEQAGLNILADGIIKPGNVDIKRGNKLTPIIGRTYMTPRMDMAGIYAIGANMLGSKLWDSDIEKNGRYGYLFVINSSTLGDIVPDEDYVGHAIYNLANDEYYDEDDVMSGMKKWSDSDKQSYLRFARNVLTPLQYQKAVRYDDYGDFAVAGKKMLKSGMPSNLTDLIIELGAPIAHDGPIKFDEAWRIDKTLCQQLKKDGSNFFQFAERVK